MEIFENNKLDCSKYNHAEYVRYIKKEKCEEIEMDGDIKIEKEYILTVLEGIKGNNGYIYKFISFNNFENIESKIPDGYEPDVDSYILSEKYIKKYKFNPEAKKLEKNNEISKQIMEKYKNNKKYYILQNGGKPYLVYVGKKNIKIYKNSDKFYVDEEYNYEINMWTYIELIRKYKSLKTFIGYSPKNNMTIYSGGHGERFDGNSILIKIKNNKYVYIGPEIFSFKTDDDIIEYISPVGNSGVPYPYAIDNKGKYYLLIEGVILNDIPKYNINDPYEYYYENINITTDMRRISPREPKIKYFNNIVEYYIGDHKYTLNYCPDAEANYDSLRKADNDGLKSECSKKIYILKTDNEKYELTKDMYIKIMEDFGKMKGYSKLKYKIIQERLY